MKNEKNDSKDYHKNNNRNNDNKGNRPFKKQDKINDFTNAKAGDYFDGVCKIVRKAVPGPVIFVLSDGMFAVDGVIRESNFDVDDIVKVSGSVDERAGKLQIEIKKIEKTDFDFNKLLDEKSKPVRTDFSIESDRFNKMKIRFVEIAHQIRKAILNNQPILIRHHNDSDGINSGLAIERSCKGLMKRLGINPEYNLYRSPSKAPFYEVADVFRDISLVKRLVDVHEQKNPLILVLDNGSTPEDVFGMKTMKSLGCDVIVIDHHNPVELKDGKTSVCPYLLNHLNPYMFGLDSETCAGMLCYETARMIDEEFENKLMPAIAAISDRSNIEETDEYIEQSGKSRESLGKIGVAIDFTAYNMRFDPGKGVFDELYVNEELVSMINEEVSKGVETQLQSTLPYLRTQEINGVTFSSIDLEKYTLRFTYPTPGKVLGMIHDKVAEGKDAVITIGCLSDMVIVRATKPILPVQTIIDNLQKVMPEANVDGGGHEMAGAIKFVQAHSNSVLQNIKQQLRNIELNEE
ncbi:hypothetical protein KY321_04925 [Candidatus Woesearchaeota archaeon]|nr:hypothetical protein [Candidatus Woesearchaeota archaeon]